MPSFTFRRRSAAALVFALGAGLSAQSQPNRITGLLDPHRLAPLKGNISPRARAQNDLGPAPRSLTLPSVTLHLKPTPAQQADLDQFLAALQNPSSPDYHRWLTPEQYADRFGASPADMAQIVAWLQSQGLTIVSQARGRNFVTFSGSVAQVEAALNTSIHHYLVDGVTHFANATEPSVPQALESSAIGFSGLHDFKWKSGSKPVSDGSLGGQHVLAPGDLWTIYDTAPFYAAGISGQGMKLVVVGQSDVNLSDIAAYRTKTNLPANLPTKLLAPGSADPGFTSAPAEQEADLDLEVTGAIAPAAQILFVYAAPASGGAFGAALYAIDNDLAPVISMSWAICEPNVSPANAALLRSEAQKASGLGITLVASSGDSGAAACDLDTSFLATEGAAVNLPASIPEVTAVGGTEFIEASGNYWGAASNPFALSYIPEVAWNESAAMSGGTDLWASGGGISQFFPRPLWQAGPGTQMRLVPDVAFSAAAHDGYYVFSQGSDIGMRGTSAAAPVAAGIVTLIAQAGGGSGLGSINQALYSLWSNAANVCSTYAVTPGCVFHDVTGGSNSVPGVTGYSAGPGYDMVTGLGSVDAANLLQATRALAPNPPAPTPTPTPTPQPNPPVLQNPRPPLHTPFRCGIYPWCPTHR